MLLLHQSVGQNCYNRYRRHHRRRLYSPFFKKWSSTAIGRDKKIKRLVLQSSPPRRADVLRWICMEICPLAPPPARLYYRFCSDNNKDPSPGCTPVNKRLLLLLSAGSCRCATGYTNNRRFVHYAKKEWPTHNQAKKKQKRKGFRSMAPGTLPCYSPTQKRKNNKEN